jgi:hypothetical protein
MAQAELLLPKNLSNAAEFASVPLAATLHVGDSRAPARVFESRRDLWPAGLSRGVVATDGTLPLTHVWDSICSRRRRIRDAFCT